MNNLCNSSNKYIPDKEIGKKIKLCLNGDYDFLCKAYGISGATGKFPCIWCLVPSDELDRTDKEYSYRQRYTVMAASLPFALDFHRVSRRRRCL